jgi:CTP synthase
MARSKRRVVRLYDFGQPPVRFEEEDRVAKHIFVTGGVCSSLGKGLTSASIGMLLERRGLTIRLQKFDPYLNVDPGTMSPYQHGEVYVLDDGAETDLDLGHYERFTSAPLTRDCNVTTGRVYQNVITKERRGDYLGSTVQVIPHVTDEIKAAIKRLTTDHVDVVITEIGGTVGDIESLPFLEAIRQYALDVGRSNVLYIHLTLVPFLKAAAEAKTKPTQHSVGQLREIGIQPDILICRTERSLDKSDRKKIGLFCNVEGRAVIEERDKDFSVYEVPISLLENGLDELIIEKLGLRANALQIDDWHELLSKLKNPEHEVAIAVVGKYVRHKDAYKSIYESLEHAGAALSARVVARRVESEDIEREGPERHLGAADGILVPGGFGDRGIEGKIAAIRFAREHRVPFFGICLGMQCAVIEFARNVLGLEGANSSEFDNATEHPVICMMHDQRQLTDKGGTMRLGAYTCQLTIDSRAYQAYGREFISERHRHRYEFNDAYRARFRAHGLKVTGVNPERGLVEIIELDDHPWFVAVQFHPEFQSKLTVPHPLFRGLVESALCRCQTRKLEPSAAPCP